MRVGSYLYVCPLCQAETHERDPWESHMADCPNKVDVTRYLYAVLEEQARGVGDATIRRRGNRPEKRDG